MSSLPLNLYTAAQVGAFDRHVIEQLGVAGYALMCRAGQAAFDCLRQRWPQARNIAVICGGGNNGGDGYVLARLAAEAGLNVVAYAGREASQLKGDALRAYQDCQSAHVPVRPFEAQSLQGADVVVDALFGTGLDRALEAAACAWVAAINNCGAPVLALDLPSGLNADTGAIMGAAVRADVTISFMALKLGCFTGDGQDCVGTLVFDALNAPAAPESLFQPVARRLQPDAIGRCLPRRRRNAHKGDFGRVLIIGGAPSMPGAVRLCGEACLRSGAGAVTIAAHPTNIAAVIAARPELMGHGIDAAAALAPLLEAADVVVVGPGLGREEWSRQLFERALACDKPLVIDADGLNLLAELSAPPVAVSGNWVLTPHPGEAGRLLGTTARDVQRNRPAAVQALVNRYGGVVVLKGSGTLIAGGNGPFAVCDRGNPGMASAGMGDVLTGVIAGVMAQAGRGFEAVCAAVLAHALAGDAAAARLGERGLIASDVIAQLRECLNPRYK